MHALKALVTPSRTIPLGTTRSRLAAKVTCSQCSRRVSEAIASDCTHCEASNVCDKCRCLCSPMAQNIRLATHLRNGLPVLLASVLRLEGVARLRSLTASETHELDLVSSTADRYEAMLRSYAVQVGLA